MKARNTAVGEIQEEQRGADELMLLFLEYGRHPQQPQGEWRVESIVGFEK